MNYVPVRERNFIVKGWAFRDHTPEEIEAIRQFLKDGDEIRLPEKYKTKEGK